MCELSLTKSVLLTDLTLCVNRYRLFTPGIYVCVCIPVSLDDETRFIAGLVAQVNHGRLKQCEATEKGFIGPPNFVLDVFESNEMDEYEKRKAAYGRSGVIEYVAVIADDEVRCEWNRHNGTDFEAVAPDENGVIKSKAMPGLWFSTDHLAKRDWWAMGDMIERGISRLGHHEFMETIWHKEGRKKDSADWFPFDAG